MKLITAVTDGTADLHEGNAFLGLLVEEGDALLEALLVRLPGLQQLSFPGAVRILDCSWHIHVLCTDTTWLTCLQS